MALNIILMMGWYMGIIGSVISIVGGIYFFLTLKTISRDIRDNMKYLFLASFIWILYSIFMIFLAFMEIDIHSILWIIVPIGYFLTTISYMIGTERLMNYFKLENMKICKLPKHNKNLPKNKKGISPVIATVLLITMVIVIGLIVFLWIRGLVVEGCEKFDKACVLNCEDVMFDADYSNGVLAVSNTGNIPIFRVKLKIATGGDYETKDIKEISTIWPDSGLNTGEVFSSENIIGNVGSPEAITVIPVLVGSSNEGEKSYSCDNNGIEISLT